MMGQDNVAGMRMGYPGMPNGAGMQPQPWNGGGMSNGMPQDYRFGGGMQQGGPMMGGSMPMGPGSSPPMPGQQLPPTSPTPYQMPPNMGAPPTMTPPQMPQQMPPNMGGGFGQQSRDPRMQSVVWGQRNMMPQRMGY